MIYLLNVSAWDYDMSDFNIGVLESSIDPKEICAKIGALFEEARDAKMRAWEACVKAQCLRLNIPYRQQTWNEEMRQKLDGDALVRAMREGWDTVLRLGDIDPTNIWESIRQKICKETGGRMLEHVEVDVEARTYD
jgi:hypothetical protein